MFYLMFYSAFHFMVLSYVWFCVSFHALSDVWFYALFCVLFSKPAKISLKLLSILKKTFNFKISLKLFGCYEKNVRFHYVVAKALWHNFNGLSRFDLSGTQIDRIIGWKCSLKTGSLKVGFWEQLSETGVFKSEVWNTLAGTVLSNPLSSAQLSLSQVSFAQVIMLFFFAQKCFHNNGLT